MMTNRIRSQLLVLAALWAGCLASSVAGGADIAPSALRNHPAIKYSETAPEDAIARLDRAVRAGEVTLHHDAESGYLESVLEALGVRVDSQVLVFSKTSFQAPKISPKNPRALYFNDSAVVGYIRDADVLEFVGQDPRQGSMFYTLSQSSAGRPEFKRNAACILCHTAEATMNVPGLMVTSVYPEQDGTASLTVTYTTDHRSPYDVRWGGWYVTGKHRQSRHLGNAVVTDRNNMLGMVTPETVHTESLAGKFEPAGYPAMTSDIVALMALEHQTAISNLITRVGWEARVGAAEVGRPLEENVAALVDYMLFVEEPPLAGPIEWSSYARHFADGAPRDGKGRSLRDLDLERRLLRYPCSYMIYSAAFDALPANAKSAVYARLWNVLSGQVAGEKYTTLSAVDRAAVLEILRATKADLPAYFGGGAVAQSGAQSHATAQAPGSY
jgi:hypothetical protein